MSASKMVIVSVVVIVLAAVLIAWLSARSHRPVRRFHAVTGLRPESADYYYKLHADTWPGVLKMIRDANLRNFSIAVTEIEGKLYLISYYEYVGRDFDADMKKVASDPETLRWWKETEPCQLPLPEAAALGEIWTDAREVFYTP